MKVLRVRFSSGDVYEIPAQFIARQRADYYANREKELGGDDEYDEIFGNEFKEAMSADYLITDWAANNMDWNDLKVVAKKVEPEELDYANEWTNAEMEVVERE